MELGISWFVFVIVHFLSTFLDFDQAKNLRGLLFVFAIISFVSLNNMECISFFAHNIFCHFFAFIVFQTSFFIFFFFWCYKRTGTKFFCLFFDGMKSIDPRYCVNGLSEWNIENMKSTTLCFPVKLSASVMLHMRTVCFMDHWFIVSNLKLFKIESSSGNDYLLET